MDNITLHRKIKEGFVGEKRIVLPPTTKRTITHNSMTRILYPTAIGYYPHATHHHIERKYGCGQYILIYCTEGEGYIHINQKQYCLQPNTFLIIPKHVYHRYFSSEVQPWSIYWVHFCGDIDEQLYDRSLVDGKPTIHSIPYEEHRIRMFENIYHTLEQSFDEREMEIACLNTLNWVSALVYYRESALSPFDRNGVGDSIAYMKKNIHVYPSITTLATQQGLSVSHYSRIFKKQTGHSPVHYFNILKIQTSCQYLYFTEKNIKEICMEVGFKDPYYFSRLFTKINGMSPTNYRKLHKNTYVDKTGKP